MAFDVTKTWSARRRGIALKTRDLVPDPPVPASTVAAAQALTGVREPGGCLTDCGVLFIHRFEAVIDGMRACMDYAVPPPVPGKSAGVPERQPETETPCSGLHCSCREWPNPSRVLNRSSQVCESTDTPHSGQISIPRPPPSVEIQPSGADNSRHSGVIGHQRSFPA